LFIRQVAGANNRHLAQPHKRCGFYAGAPGSDNAVSVAATRQSCCSRRMTISICSAQPHSSCDGRTASVEGVGLRAS
jgi:hypothetical protein